MSVKKTSANEPATQPAEDSLGPDTELERDVYGIEVVDDAKTSHQDFLTSLILIGISIYVIITSLGYWQKQKVVFYESAGFVPILITSGLLLMSIRLMKQSLKQDSVKNYIVRIKKGTVETIKSNKVHRALVGLALFWVYVFLMLGKMPFWLASFLTLAAVLVFVRFDKKWQTSLKMIVIAALCVAGIVGLFQFAFSVPMP